MRGRKPTPAALKLVCGNPGRRQVDPGMKVAAAGAPKPPTCLDAEALVEWRRVTPMLTASGVLTPADRAILAAYCQAWSCWAEAESKLNEFGRMVASPRGLPVPSPWLQVAGVALQQFVKAASELGLTPVARARVKAGAEKPAEDPAERFFKAANG